MTSFRTTRTARARPGRIRPHVLRRDGVIEAPSDIPHRDRYQLGSPRAGGRLA